MDDDLTAISESVHAAFYIALKPFAPALQRKQIKVAVEGATLQDRKITIDLSKTTFSQQTPRILSKLHPLGGGLWLADAQKGTIECHAVALENIGQRKMNDLIKEAVAQQESALSR